MYVNFFHLEHIQYLFYYKSLFFIKNINLKFIKCINTENDKKFYLKKPITFLFLFIIYNFFSFKLVTTSSYKLESIYFTLEMHESNKKLAETWW